MNYIAPEDKQIIKYFLEFNNESDGVFEIDMPIGFDKMKMKMKTNADGYGRYLEFSDELDIVFVREFNHQFELLRNYVKKYAWHTDIDFFMEIDGVNFVEGKLDFEQSFKTDYSNEIKSKIIFENLRKKIENKKNTPIELNSNKALDNRTEITPINLEDLLTKEQFFYNSLKFQNNNLVGITTKNYLGEISGIIFNSSTTLTAGKYVGSGVVDSFIDINNFNLDINSSNFYIGIYQTASLPYDLPPRTVSWNFRSKNPIYLGIVLRNIKLKYIGTSNFTFFRLAVTYRYFDNDTFTTQIGHGQIVLGTFYDPIVEIDYYQHQVVQLNQYVRIVFVVEIDHDNDPDDFITFEWNNEGIIEYQIKEDFGDSTTKAVRLVSVGEQIIKSVTNGNEISNFDAPRFKSYFNENKINFFDLYVTSGLYLRGFNNEKFTTKWNDFVNFIRKALNSDYQIYNNKIFLGHYKDFRNDVEIARYEFEIDSENYEVTFNDRLIKSNFKIGYKKYEDDGKNTLNSIHQEAEFLVVDSNLTEENLDNSIDYICDAYKIEYTRRESFAKDSTKGTPNDKDIYVIDTFNNNGILENRTNQGVQYTYNIFSPETFYNLRLSVKRLLYDYFSNTLAEISQYNYDDTPVINVDYKPNKLATIKYNSNFGLAKDKETIEGGNFDKNLLENPLVSGQVYEFTLLRRFEFVEFLELVEQIMDTGGYLTFYSETKEISIFPIEINFEWELNKLKIKGEKKWILIL